MSSSNSHPEDGGITFLGVIGTNLPPPRQTDRFLNTFLENRRIIQLVIKFTSSFNLALHNDIYKVP